VISWNQVDVGPNHVCAVTTQQDIWCFGLNAFGEFGTGTTSTTRTDGPVTAAIRSDQPVAQLAVPIRILPGP
jgi:alpha-tubulin suppressor-like RCC1 family protein